MPCQSDKVVFRMHFAEIEDKSRNGEKEENMIGAGCEVQIVA